MSQLRPSLLSSDGTKYCPLGASAYYEVLGAVQQQDGLLHKKLDNAIGEHCAMGSYYSIHKNQSFPTDVLDEIASINDSVPKLTKEQRKEYVIRWLKFKLRCFGWSYRQMKPPTQKDVKKAVKK